MEHAVLGAGAIGGLVGTAVASLGEGVTVLVRPERLPGYPANLSVERPSGAITALAKVAATLTNPVDVLWIATKTYQLKAALQAVQTLLWSKLCFLGPFALVTSASGMNKGEIYADAEWKRKLISAMAESCAVAKASGAEVDPAQIQAIFDGLPSGTRSSMQKDLASSRRLELDAIGGPIARGGERYGIDVSTTATLIAVIRAKATE